MPGRSSRISAIVALLVGGLAVAAGRLPAAAQDGRPRATINLAQVVTTEPEVEASLDIRIQPETALPPQSFLRIRGLPVGSRLSEGHAIAPGAWAVPLTALPTLRVVTPVAGSGRSELAITLLDVDGNVLAEAKSSLVVAPAWLLGGAASASRPRSSLGAGEGMRVEATAPPQPMPARRPDAAPVPPVTAGAPPPPPPPAPPPAVVASLPPPAMPPPGPALVPPTRAAPSAPPPAASLPPLPVITPEAAERIAKLTFQGDTYRAQGNIAAARQFYRRAADMGSSLAAMRLAGTYDAAELAQLSVRGLDADPAEARRWYEKARDLGDPEAVSRLARLPAGK